LRGAAGAGPQLAGAHRQGAGRRRGAGRVRRAAGPVRDHGRGPRAGAVQMKVDLGQIKAELDAAPIEPPYPPGLAIAVIADVLRHGEVEPRAAADFQALVAKGPQRPGQLAALARALAWTSLRPASVAALRARPPASPLAMLDELLEKIHPVTGELFAQNPFRR